MIRRTLICLLFAAAASCAAAPAQEPAVPAPAPAASAGSDLVVLRVAGEPVTERQVLAALAVLARQKQLPAGTQQERNVNLFKGAVDNITIQTLLKHEAQRRNISADPAKVEEQWQEILKRFPSQADFQKALAAEGATDAALRKSIEDSLRVQRVLDLAVQDVPAATDEEVQKFYEGNPQAFQRKEQVHAAHILLVVQKDAAPEKKAEIRSRLESIRGEIESQKITFSGAAARYSEDSANAAQGGDLGFFTRGRMVPQFEEAAFNGEPGSLSPVFETQFGFHIVRVIEKKPEGKIPLDEAGPGIRRHLDQAAKSRATQQYVNELKSKAAIENFMTAEEFIRRHMADRPASGR